MNENIIKEAVKIKSNISSMRVGLFFDLFACVGLAVLAIILNRDLTGTAAIIVALLSPMAIGKGIQAKYE